MSNLTVRKPPQPARAPLCLLWVALILISPGCQGESGTLPSGTNELPDAGISAGADGGGDTRTDAGTDAGTPWTALIDLQWFGMPQATQRYVCRTIQVDNELYITGFRSIAPVGQYREFLVVADSPPGTGDYNCNAGILTNGRMIHASGMGTGSFAFPSGIAVRVKAHQYLTLILHLFNPTETTLGGTSGVEVQLGSPVPFEYQAGMVLAGTFNISIPPDGQLHTAQGGCAFPSDFKVFALWPTMNGIGVRQQMKLSRGIESYTLLDDAYDIHHQTVYPISVEVKRGDQIQTTCYYRNQTGHPVTFGDTSNAELCFTGMYHYPVQENSFACVP